MFALQEVAKRELVSRRFQKVVRFCDKCWDSQGSHVTVY